MALHLLLVEDNDLEATKIARALAAAGIAHEIERAQDGLEALERLRGGDAVPSLVLLDLNLPRMNGFEFLEAREREPALLAVPVFVLTTSSRQSDIDRCHRHRIAGYLVKPATVPAMVETLSVAARFWSLCRLPASAG